MADPSDVEIQTRPFGYCSRSALDPENEPHSIQRRVLIVPDGGEPASTELPQGEAGYLPRQTGVVGALSDRDSFAADHCLAAREQLLEVIRDA